MILCRLCVVDPRQYCEQALRRAAWYSESHSLKGLLAIQELQARLPIFTDEFWGEWLTAFGLFDVPQVSGLFGAHLHVDFAWDRSRMIAVLEGGVFPLAYVAAEAWRTRYGLEDLVQSFRPRALQNIGGLGHSFTIWLSFAEILPWLNDELLQKFAAERFAELISTQLRTQTQSCEPKTPSLAQILAASLTKPGYFAHNLISVAAILRAKSKLTREELSLACQRLWPQIESSPEHSLPEQRWEDVAQSVALLLRTGPRDVHTLTLAQACFAMWDDLDRSQQCRLLAVIADVRDCSWAAPSRA